MAGKYRKDAESAAQTVATIETLRVTGQIVTADGGAEFSVEGPHGDNVQGRRRGAVAAGMATASH